MSGRHAGEAAGAEATVEGLRAECASLAARLVREASAAGLTVATAESLTAGLVAATIADVPGASAILRGGVVSYAVDVKASVLGVDEARLASHGPVDGPVAEQMAAGAARVCGADLGVSTTGVAGPEPHGGHAVGTVYVGMASRVQSHEHGGVQDDAARAHVTARVEAAPSPDEAGAGEGETARPGRQGGVGHRLHHFDGDRDAIRWASVRAALQALLHCVTAA